MEKREVVNGEHDRHAVVERQIFRHLIGGVPEIDQRRRQEGPDERPQRPQKNLFFPRADGDAIEAARGKVAIGIGAQEEDRLKPTGCQSQQFLPEMH